ncbi:MAG: PP2C family protein-serine/threonine phosphatase [Mycobacteriales bacterium]
MGLILRTGAASDVGLVRTNNEDSAFTGRRLLAVADGVGGMPAGEVASDLVIQSLAGLEEAPAEAEPLGRLRDAVEAANQRIRASSEADDGRHGMGTTVTALLLHDDQLALLHVGDSRCYLLRDGQLGQVTRDDTYVQTLVDQGVMSREDARRHPQRSVVTQAVQGVPLSPAARMLTPAPGDRYLLCSDGLSDYVDDAAIAEALRSYRDPQDCADRLVQLALDAGAPDNVTVIVADVAADTGADPAAAPGAGSAGGPGVDPYATADLPAPPG